MAIQNLPTPEVYQKEFKYIPWGILISKIIKIVTEKTPKNAKVLDLLCGTGYLIGEIQKQRSDIKFIGVDIEKNFINYAEKQYPKINFYISNVLSWKTKEKYDVILCTGGLHHIPYHKQELLIHKISKLLNKKGFAIIADPYINDYSNETERKLAVSKLGYEYLIATIKNEATNDVIKAMETLIGNDLFLVEFKNSTKKTLPYFKNHFSYIKKYKTWPKKNSNYGDYYFILKK